MIYDLNSKPWWMEHRRQADEKIHNRYGKGKELTRDEYERLLFEVTEYYSLLPYEKPDNWEELIKLEF